MFGARPAAEAEANPQGTKPGTKLAAFTKLEAVSGTPGGCEVTLALVVIPPEVALIVMLPATLPAVIVVAACPCASVVAVAGLIDPEPDAILNVTRMPGIGLPWASTTWKTTGCGNTAEVKPVWPPPLTSFTPD